MSNSIFKSVGDFFARTLHNDVAMDLGTMNTLCYVRGQGIALDEPTVITLNTITHEVIAVGNEAKKMLGVSGGNLLPVRPMRNGAMSDPAITQKLLSVFLRKVSSPLCIMKPRVLVAVPSGISQLVRQAVIDTFIGAGARTVRLVEEPLAAAVGANLPVETPEGCMIVDIGGGTSEIAIVALGNIIHCNSVTSAGDAMDQAIIEHMKQRHNLSIGELMSEKIKITLGSAVPFSELGQEERPMQVCGQQLKSHGDNLPGSVEIDSEEIRAALMEPIEKIIEGIKQTLATCRPSLASNLAYCGMTITGGSSQLPGLANLLRKRFDLPVHTASSPTKSVMMGLGKIMERNKIFDAPQADAVGATVGH